MPPAALLDRSERGLDFREDFGRQLVGRVIGELLETHLLERVVLFVRRQSGQRSVEDRLARGIGEDGLHRRIEIEPCGRCRGGIRSMSGMFGICILGEGGRSGGGRDRGGNEKFHGVRLSGVVSAALIGREVNAA